MLSHLTLSEILRPERLPQKSVRDGSTQARALSECLALEVQSAGSPLNRKLQLELADSYARLGCAKTSTQLLRRLTQFQDAQGEVFTRILDRAVNSGDLKLISSLYGTCKSLPNPDAALIKTLARASEKLGQSQLAADHWANLVRQQSLAEGEWMDLARFVSRNQNCQPLTEALLPLASSKSNFRNHSPALQFCLVCSMLQSNRGRARSFLDCIPVNQLDDADISFELAIVSFRLGDYAFALKAVKQLKWVTQGSQSPLWLENMVRLFNGEPVHDQLSKTIRIDTSVNEVVQKKSREAQSNRFLQGRIQMSSRRPQPAAAAILKESRAGQLDAEILSLAATYSVLAEGLHVPDPWEILADTDLSVPHLMVQRTHRETRIHAFVPTGRRSSRFPWEPARLEVADLLKSNGKTVDVGAAIEPRSRENPLWTRALEEISQFDMEEMTSDNER